MLCVALAIVAATWHTIDGPHREVGDFAANSLLIQDAKHLQLLRGNYSRIGVNHPGPAILYVLAAGEWLFHDVLSLVPTPFGGQLIAAAFYTAFWTMLIARGLLALSGSWKAATIGTAVFFFATTWSDHSIPAGVWFPHLYYFPFAVFLVSAARLATGRTDRLVSLAISAGFLVNGHVSFVPTVAVLLVVVLMANLVLFRSVPEQRILTRRFLDVHRRRLVVMGGVFALFLVPLALDTILHFPGPVAQYIAFGGAQDPNTAAGSFQFMTVYWGGKWLLSAGLFALLLAIWSSRRHALRFESTKGLFVAVIAATLALLVYARYGVDFLDYVYLGFFYYAVPALTVSILAICVLERLPSASRGFVAITIALFCSGFVISQIRLPLHYQEQYDEPELDALYSTMKQAAGEGRLVLDVDTDAGWGYVWLRLVGVEAMAKRRGENLFCIHRNWHILFTDAARCTPAELRTDRRFIVRMVRPEQASAEAPLIERAKIGFFRYAPPDLTGKGVIVVATHQLMIDDYVLDSGWSPPEPEYVWSEGRESHIALHVVPRFEGVVTLDVSAYLPKAKSDQMVTVGSGVGVSKTYVFSHGNQRQSIKVPIRGDDSGYVDIELAVDHPISPRAAKVGGDRRVLGVALYSIEVDAKRVD